MNASINKLIKTDIISLVTQPITQAVGEKLAMDLLQAADEVVSVAEHECHLFFSALEAAGARMSDAEFNGTAKNVERAIKKAEDKFNKARDLLVNTVTARCDIYLESLRGATVPFEMQVVLDRADDIAKRLKKVSIEDISAAFVSQVDVLRQVREYAKVTK